MKYIPPDIETKYFGPTNSKGSRIRAKNRNTGRVKYLSVSSMDGSPCNLHCLAAIALLNSEPDKRYTDIHHYVCVEMPRGYLFLFSHNSTTHHRLITVDLLQETKE